MVMVVGHADERLCLHAVHCSTIPNETIIRSPVPLRAFSRKAWVGQHEPERRVGMGRIMAAGLWD